MERLNLRLPVILLSLPHALLGVVLQVYAAELGFDPIQTTGLFWVFSLVVLAVRLFSGRLTDHIGRRRAFLLACGFYTLSYMIFCVSVTLPMLYLARVIQAFGAAFYITACYAMIGDISSNDFGKNFGAFTAYRSKGGLFGMAVSGISFAGVGFFTGWSRMFVLFSLAGVAATIVALKKLPETGKQATLDRVKIKLSTDKKRVLMLYFIACMANCMANVVLVMYLNAKFQPRFEQLALTFIAAISVVAFIMPRAGRMIDAIGSFKAMMISMLLSAFSLLALIFAPSLVLFGAVWAGYSIAVAVMITAIDACYSHGIEDSNRGSMMSKYISISDAGAMIGSALTGVLFKQVGASAVFVVSALLLGGMCALIWLYRKKYIMVME